MMGRFGKEAGNGTPLKMADMLVSMLDFWGVTSILYPLQIFSKLLVQVHELYVFTSLDDPGTMRYPWEGNLG